MAWTPPLRLDATGDGCRLMLVGVTHGNGRTMQEAADDLIARLIRFARARFRVPLLDRARRADPRVLELLWEVGELAARGEGVRDRVFTARRTRPRQQRAQSGRRTRPRPRRARPAG